IRRPPNAFFLYRSHLWDTVKTQWAENSEKRQVNFSKYAGEQWQCESAEVRDHWEARAATEKKAHKERYPDYKFSP
ncbi:high mobility group box domain-containing protein, partial [Dichomitus squalens]